jgi:hypothetical protein
MQAHFDACERNGGHAYFGTHLSNIVHPELMWGGNPFQTFLDKGGPPITYAAWKCSKCGSMASQEEAWNYMDGRARNAAYYESRLWC